MTNEETPRANRLSTGLILLMAFACGAKVANIYYAQTFLLPLASQWPPPSARADHRPDHGRAHRRDGARAPAGQFLGWRSVYSLSSGLMTLIGLALALTLPRRLPPAQKGYGAILVF
ncbi:MAG: hypothetical protein ABI540_02450 [Spartobacteria bacterium]